MVGARHYAPDLDSDGGWPNPHIDAPGGRRRGAGSQQWRARLFGYLFRRTDDPSLAEELASDVLFEVWRGAKRFKGDSPASTWIFGIAHHKAMSSFRKRRPESVEIEAAAETADPGEGPEEAAASGERGRRLREAIRRLSPDHREVIDLTFFHGCSHTEIARIIKCPVATVKTRMFYARKKDVVRFAEAAP